MLLALGLSGQKPIPHSVSEHGKDSRSAPKSQHDVSIHIDVAAHHLTLASGLSVLNQLLSIAAWLDDIYAVPLTLANGATEPNRQTRQTREFPTSILQGWCSSRKPVEDERKRLALAIYREAVNMAQFHSLPFAVVGFYRVLEVIWPDGRLRYSGICRVSQ